MVFKTDMVLSLPNFSIKTFVRNSKTIDAIRAMIITFRYCIFSPYLIFINHLFSVSCINFFNFTYYLLYQIASLNKRKSRLGRDKQNIFRELIFYLFDASLASFIFSFNLASWSSVVIAPTTSSPTILPFLSTTIVVG